MLRAGCPLVLGLSQRRAGCRSASPQLLASAPAVLLQPGRPTRLCSAATRRCLRDTAAAASSADTPVSTSAPLPGGRTHPALVQPCPALASPAASHLSDRPESHTFPEPVLAGGHAVLLPNNEGVAVLEPADLHASLHSLHAAGPRPIVDLEQQVESAEQQQHTQAASITQLPPHDAHQAPTCTLVLYPPVGPSSDHTSSLSAAQQGPTHDEAASSSSGSNHRISDSSSSSEASDVSSSCSSRSSQGIPSSPHPSTSQPGEPSAASGAGAHTPSSAPAAALDGQPGHIPQPILVICCVSAALTMASCVFNTLLPIYMVTELKMSMRSMGMFEGLLEAFSYVVRMFSGVVSDMMASRKTAITLGFVMGAMAKFGMAGSTTVAQLFASKAVDRLANGVQAAPRDALISDLAPAASRSACFGFAQSLRKWGSFVGAGLSFLLMRASGNNYQLIFLLASSVSVAACIAFVVLVPSYARPPTPMQQQAAAQQAAYDAQQTRLAAKAASSGASSSGTAASPGGTAGEAGSSQPLLARPVPPSFQLSQFMQDVRGMGADFYRMLLTVSLYGMGHIGESMLEARAIEVGFGKAESSLIVCALAFVIFLVAYPLGRLDDRYGPRVTFAVGMSALILGDLTLLCSGAHPIAVFIACAFLGVHWGVIQGPMLSIVVGLAPAHLRGTAFGIFYTVMAVTALLANTMFGSVWTAFGAPAMFGLSATIMAGTLVSLPALLPASVKGGRQAMPAQPHSARPAAA